VKKTGFPTEAGWYSLGEKSSTLRTWKGERRKKGLDNTGNDTGKNGVGLRGESWQ